MKNLSSLTTFFVVFLFVVYLGVFTGLKVNTLISGKKLVAASPSPPASIAAQPTSTPTSKPLTTLAKAPATKAQVQAATSQTAPVPTPTSVAAPVAVPVVVTDATVPPAPAVDTSSTPPPEATPAPSVPPPSDRCIITLSGGQYDVTDFRNIHSGGDVFQCGTDMTASFLSRHPASFLSKMSQYKV